MAGVNTSGNASGDNVVLGRGRLYFASLGADGLPDESGYRDLGNVTDFQTTAAAETLDRKNFRSGLAVVDKKIVTEQSVSLSFVLDELTFDNISLFFSGEALDNGLLSPNNTAVTNAPIAASETIGTWYELRDVNGVRYFDLAAYDAASAVAGSFHVEVNSITMSAAQVEVDLDVGMFRLIDDGIASGAVTWSSVADSNNRTVDQVRGLTTSSLQGALKFISENPANNDEKVEYQFHKATLLADGEMALIGDELATIPISGQVEENLLADPDSGFVTITGAPETSTP